MVKVCTVNVGTLLGKRREFVEMLARRQVDICCIQEVRYKNQGTTAFGSNEEKYKFWYSGNTVGTNGVGIPVRSELAERVLEVERYNDRLMKIRMVLGKGVCHIFSAYAPQVGLTTQEKEEFWELMEEEIAKVPNSEGVIIGGDLNGHIGSDREGYEEIRGLHSFGVSNREGETILEFAKNHNLRILNTYFKKDRNKTVTYVSGEAETQLDFVLMRPKPDMIAVDCRAIPGESCAHQHRPVRADIRISSMKRRKVGGRKKYKIWKLKDEAVREEFEKRLEDRFQSGNVGWSEMQNDVAQVCKDLCGVTSGKRGRERETWWWNESVQQAIANKKAAFKIWQRSNSSEDRELYRDKNREAKRAVALAKRQALDEWCGNLDSAEGKKKMFAMAKQLKKDKKDIVGGYFVKNKDGDIVTEESGIQEVWKEYFNTLLNQENPNEIPHLTCVEGPIADISEDEVARALRAMKPNKAPGPSGISSELLKYSGNAGLKQLTKVYQEIMESEICPEEWKDSTTLPFFKGKGDPLNCSKYRGIRLLEHGMKVWEKILEGRLKKIVTISDNQFGFSTGKSTTDAIFILRHLQQKYSEKKKSLYHIFVDLEKAFDRVPRGALVWAMRRQLVPEKLIRLVMALYNDSRSSVAAAGGTSDPFLISVGVHQGSTLSPLLFNLVLEEATRECRRGVPWDLLYADDLVLTAESKAEVLEQMNEWRKAMESKGLKVNIEKTKIMVTGKECESTVNSGKYPCGVCGKGVGSNSVLCTECGKWVHHRCSHLQNVLAARDYVCPRCVRLRNGPITQPEDVIIGPEEGDVVEEVESFCYLGTLVDREGGVERAVRARVAAAWAKWREIAGLLTNKRIPLKSRAHIYETCIRSVLLYGAESWPLTQRLEKCIQSCDRRMLRYLTGVSLLDRVRSADVAKRCGLDEIQDVMRRRRLQWYGHVQRRGEGEALSIVRDWEVEGRRPRGRPKKSWLKTIKEDMSQLGIDENLVNDRQRWREDIRGPTPPSGNRRP